MSEKFYIKCKACDGQGSQVFDEVDSFNSVMSLPPSFCIVCEGTGFVEQNKVSSVYKGKVYHGGSFVINIDYVIAVIPASKFSGQKIILIDGTKINITHDEAKNVIKMMGGSHDQ